VDREGLQAARCAGANLLVRLHHPLDPRRREYWARAAAHPLRRHLQGTLHWSSLRRQRWYRKPLEISYMHRCCSSVGASQLGIDVILGQPDCAGFGFVGRSAPLAAHHTIVGALFD
jgi:hypothetical protein